MSADWERGYDAGYRAALGTATRDISVDMGAPKPSSAKRVPKRKGDRLRTTRLILEHSKK